MLVCVTNESKGAVLASRAKVASSLLARSLGLLGTASLPDGEGLWLTPCKSVHMFFMRYTIDVLFLDARGTILSGKTLKPWRISSWESQSVGVLELPAGTLARTKTQAGDKVTIKQI